MASDLKALDLLFQRPLEPVFIPRDNGKAAFDVPDEYLTERYSSIQDGVTNIRYGADEVEVKIPVRTLNKHPDLNFAKKIGQKQQFCLFNDLHKDIAGHLIGLLLEAEDLQQFVSLCAFVKDRINPVLFQYCYSVCIQHRKDTSTVRVPPIAETFPANFVEPSVFKEARAELSIFKNAGDRMHIDIPRNYTASDREEEQRLAYFREDIGVNMHHWHWHLVYPTQGPHEIVAKDRRGELFYYMHHQLLARYNIERFCNNLARIAPLNNLRKPIREGYFPKILSSVNNRTYPARVSNQQLRDVNREENNIEISECDRWRDRIYNAIDQGYVEDPMGKRVPLDDFHGIDLLGDILESSSLSINKKFYGNLHNMGHNLISYAHDPDARHLEEFGVMGDVTTAMRDPVFYRWHQFIDNICQKFKTSLPAYDDSHLGYYGIDVDLVEVIVDAKNTRPNVLLTYWQKSDVDLAAGLDFGPNGNIYAAFTHLQNAPFVYNLHIANSYGVPKQGTCRIFLCPKTDERGTALKLEEQRQLAIEMDKFTVDLQPGGNVIRRRSDESSVTIPFERSFRRVGADYMPRATEELASFRFCGCGWPQHLLLPKGKAEGMPFDLFVMISNYADDVVHQTNSSPDNCGDAHSFCGLKDKLYPDKRAMGFPFDRRLPGDNLAAMTASYSNMQQANIVIIFNDRLIEKPTF